MMSTQAEACAQVMVKCYEKIPLPVIEPRAFGVAGEHATIDCATVAGQLHLELVVIFRFWTIDNTLYIFKKVFVFLVQIKNVISFHVHHENLMEVVNFLINTPRM